MLWSAAAWHKLQDRAGFTRALAGYELLSPPLFRLAGQMLPLLEALLAVCLLVPASRAPAALASAILLVTYGAAMAVNLVRGKADIDCGCAGSEGQVISWWLVSRNALLCCASLALLPGTDQGTLTISGFLVATLASAVICIVYIWVGSVLRERTTMDSEAD
jgi:hypothetical protein